MGTSSSSATRCSDPISCRPEVQRRRAPLGLCLPPLASLCCIACETHIPGQSRLEHAAAPSCAPLRCGWSLRERETSAQRFCRSDPVLRIQTHAARVGYCPRCLLVWALGHAPTHGGGASDRYKTL